ncbi:myc-associated zinc finger protein-like [Anopheles nili]|uniref:myc-associated zinc finger protein-like n=1 Tax=Anopheles nili TaxID=185578 RepID=UPI00237A7E38|nr:myc-associated zinc finger protein-like [Anopheles nili]
MEHGTFAQDFFCRLCASEGVVIHPLFPPGDDDPKDELVRMIEVLTSVHLVQTSDAGAVICDKCLQMLDLFCRFREECLRQDVLIRSKRTLLAEELEMQRQQLHQLQEQLLLRQQQEVSQLQLVPLLKQETDEGETDSIQQVIAEGSEEIVCTPTTPLFIATDACQNEYEEQNKYHQILVTENTTAEVEPILHQYVGTHEAIQTSDLNGGSYTTPGIAMFSQMDTLSFSVQVDETSLEGTPATVSGTVVCNTGHSSPSVARRRKRMAKPNFKKPPPACDHCQENFATYYEFHQHMNQHHAWDKTSRCSLACDPCQMRFTKSYNLKRHMYEVHGEQPLGLTVIACEDCGKRFLRNDMLERHVAKVHRNKKKVKVIAI